MSYKRKQHEATSGNTTWPSQFGSVKCNSHLLSLSPSLSLVLFPSLSNFGLCRIFHVQKFVGILCAHNYVASQKEEQRLKHKSVANRQSTHQSWSRILVWLCVFFTPLFSQLFLQQSTLRENYSFKRFLKM